MPLRPQDMLGRDIHPGDFIVAGRRDHNTSVLKIYLVLEDYKVVIVKTSDPWNEKFRQHRIEAGGSDPYERPVSINYQHIMLIDNETFNLLNHHVYQDM